MNSASAVDNIIPSGLADMQDVTVSADDMVVEERLGWHAGVVGNNDQQGEVGDEFFEEITNFRRNFQASASVIDIETADYNGDENDNSSFDDIDLSANTVTLASTGLDMVDSGAWCYEVEAWDEGDGNMHIPPTDVPMMQQILDGAYSLEDEIFWPSTKAVFY